MGGGAENKPAGGSSSSNGGQNRRPPPSYQDQPPSYHEFATAKERYNYSGHSSSQNVTVPAPSSSDGQSGARPDGGYGGSTDVPRSEPIDIPIPKKQKNDFGGRG
ncbi:hypothetical protein FHL15_002817 [Xylaria flabelliformis]|uniref:Uncharacterized protein n=1 Tax=Xylaria flabelliformis TaxID=2512241 RepID=A0A553I7C6_9PEZI|nr:hypothetical protein FHL15_002817 [Xylaria flabelliformis]